jgi:hypothetical protein
VLAGVAGIAVIGHNHHLVVLPGAHLTDGKPLEALRSAKWRS